MLTLTLIIAAGFIFMALPYGALAVTMLRLFFKSAPHRNTPARVSLFDEPAGSMTIQSADNVRMLSDEQLHTLERP